ncbi:MAG: glycosyltransferase family 1 protein [Rhodocyclales bacterium]|nr:glycosyltransferase family 1 protein [Rhodocyclales bacterium]
MTTIVCAAPPLYGHMTPLAALAGQLERQGHDVTIIDYFSTPFELPPGPARIALPSSRLDQAVHHSGGQNLVLDLINVLRDFCLEIYLPTLQRCAALKPDLLLFDQQLPIAPLLARELGCRYVFTISSPVTLLYRDEAASPIEKGIQQAFSSAYVNMCRELAERLGLSTAFPPPAHNLCFATARFCGREEPDPTVSDPATQTEVPVTFAGPAFLTRPPDAADQALTEQIAAFDGTRIYVSLGSCIANATVNRSAARRIFRNALLAHNDENTLLLYSAPADLLDEAFRDIPIRATVITRAFVNQFFLIEHFSLVYSHGGYNTLAECLLHGIPQIAFPFVFDQTRLAHRLEQLGIGRRVSRTRHTAEELRGRAEWLTNSPDARASLASLKRDIQQYGGLRYGAGTIDSILLA